MYHIAVRMPDVEWSTVPGATSRGFDRKAEDKALHIQESLVTQLKAFGMLGAFVVVSLAGEIHFCVKVEA